MLNFRDKYLRNKFKYLNQKGNGDAQRDVLENRTIADFVRYQYSAPSDRSARLEGYLNEIIEMCRDPHSRVEISFVSVRGDGLCLFSSIFEWFLRCAPEYKIDYNNFVQSITEQYRSRVEQIVRDMGMDASDEATLSSNADNVGLAYPMDSNAPHLEIVIPLICQIFSINIVLIKNNILNNSETGAPRDERLRLLYRIGTSVNIRTIFLYNTGGHISLMIPRVIHVNGSFDTDIASERIFLTKLLENRYLTINDL